MPANLNVGTVHSLVGLRPSFHAFVAMKYASDSGGVTTAGAFSHGYLNVFEKLIGVFNGKAGSA